MDRIEEVLEAQKAVLMQLLASFRSGSMTVQIDGKAATKETANQLRKMVQEIQGILQMQRKKHRKANAAAAKTAAP